VLKWILGIVAVLVVVSLALPKAEEKPEDRTYSSASAVKAAASKAGYKCPSWGKTEEKIAISGTLQSLACSNGDHISWYDGGYVDKRKEGYGGCSDIVKLNGPNWQFETAKAPDLVEDLGGKLCGS
jgi:hypothetical protein